MSGWIGVDLDGTLALSISGAPHVVDRVGDPIPAMVARVHGWLEEGRDVRILTARVSSSVPADLREVALRTIQEWCLRHLCRTLPVTAEKDYGLLELWDDRARQVEVNTGRFIGEPVCLMGLNRISNPKKLRQLSARVGQPVIRAYARFFAEQTTVLAFTDDRTAFVVTREGDVTPYPGVELLETGVRTR